MKSEVKTLGKLGLRDVYLHEKLIVYYIESFTIIIIFLNLNDTQKNKVVR